MVLSKSIQGGPVTVYPFKLSQSNPSLVVGTVDPAFLSPSSNGVLPPINLSASRYSSAVRRKRLLKRIAEELDLESGDNMRYDENAQASSTMPRGPQYYHGAFGSELGNTSFEDDEDDFELVLDEELARDGLYRGNYRNLLLLYTVVPLTTLLSFVCLALVPTLVFTTPTDSRFPYPPYLPFPILEVLTSTALWSLSYLLRDFLYATTLFITSLSSLTIITTILSATVQTTSNFLLRQIAIPVLLIPYYSKHPSHEYPTWQDDAFKRVWWVALGWAVAEAVVGVKQGYESIALYKHVLVSVNLSTLNTELGTRGRSGQHQSYAIYANNHRRGTPQKRHGDEQEDVDVTTKQVNWENPQQCFSPSPSIQRTRYSRSLSGGSNHMSIEDDPPPISNQRQPLLGTSTRRQNDNSDERLQAENEAEKDLDELIALKNREELEEVYGIPVIRIPVFISCLHRLNSILSSLGVCLLLTAAYMESTFAIPTLPFPPPSPTPSSLFKLNHFFSLHPLKKHLALTTIPIFIIYILLAMMHTPLILPRIGIHTFVYVELLVSLGVFFCGLAVWDVLS